MYQRKIAKNIQEARADTPVIFLSGPRQSGKSTLAWLALHNKPGQPLSFASTPPFNHESVATANYFSLDNASTLAAIHPSAQDFLDKHRSSGLIVIDEVQRIPEFMIAVKYEVDLDRRPGRFLLTGSANVLAIPQISESLAGRVEIIRVWPLAQCEIEGTNPTFLTWAFSDEVPSWTRTATREEIIDRAFKGGYPEALTRATSARRNAWFGTYLTNVIEREIKNISQIEDISGIVKILQAVASRSGGPRNLQNLSMDTQIARQTISRYLALLNAAFLISEIPAWSGCIDSRIIRSPKLLIDDSGLYAHLLRLSPKDTHIGFLIENFVGTELAKLISFEEIHKYWLMHFRNRDQREVDFIIEGPGRKVIGIEVKLSTTVGNDDFRGLAALQAAAKNDFHRGIILYCGDRWHSFSHNMWAIPMNALWN